MPATIDAAALCKMAERRQITGGVLDGPLAFDNAISSEAAKTKGIQSEVAGDPDILIAPDLEAGNILAKQLTLPRQRRQRRCRPRRARADHPDEPRGQRSVEDRQLRRRDARGPCATTGASPGDVGPGRRQTGVMGYGRLRDRAQRGLLEPQVLRLSEAGGRSLAPGGAGPDRGHRDLAAILGEGRSGPASLADDPLDGAVARRAHRARCARRVAPLPVRRRARAWCRSPRRAWRRAVCRSNHCHAAGSGGSAKADPARPAPSAAQPGGDRSGVRAASRRAAGRLLRHELPSRSAGRRGADSAAQGDLPRRRAALRLSRAVVRVHRLGPATGRTGDRRRGASSWRIWAAAPACAR